jgi:hypothetical protein
MNERIRELCIQSGAYEHYEVNEGVNGDELPMQRFAELIVRECLQKIKTCEVPVGNKPVLLLVSNEIKQHFGYRYSHYNIIPEI